MCSKISENLILSTNNYVQGPTLYIKIFSQYFLKAIYRLDMVH